MNNILLSRRVAAVGLALCVGLWGPAGTAQSIDPVPGQADFNGDGIADLAIGVPFEDIGTAADAGAVNVLFGGPLGPSAGGANGSPSDFLLHQNLAGVPGVSEAGDQFGRALATGDFDADGFSDLAIGVPFDDTNGNQAEDAGMVVVFFGAATGLSLERTAEITSVKAGEQFGFALAAGDFNKDGVHDLAVGAPNRIVSTVDLASCTFAPHTLLTVICGTSTGRAGGVSVYYGAAGAGLSPSGSDGFRQSDDEDGVNSTTGEVGDSALPGERFGEVLAAGDFDNDGSADLAVGAPGNDLLKWPSAPINNAGAVHVIYGHSSGLGRRLNSPSLAISEDGISAGGLLSVPGIGEGDGITGTPQAGDLFGAALAVGRTSGADALYIGVPMEDVTVMPSPGIVATASDAGTVLELRRLSDGMEAIFNDVLWSRESNGINGVAAAGDQFGFSLAAGDFNGDGRPDLAIGAPFDDVYDGVTTRANAGAVNVLYGASSGLTATGDQLWTQADDPTFGLGTAETNAEFGRGLATGNYGGGTPDDLAVGAPGRNTGGVTDAGLVQVLFGTAGGLDLGGNSLLHQDQPFVADSNEIGDRIGWVMR